jgi:hypothetical protein
MTVGFSIMAYILLPFLFEFVIPDLDFCVIEKKIEDVIDINSYVEFNEYLQRKTNFYKRFTLYFLVLTLTIPYLSYVSVSFICFVIESYVIDMFSYLDYVRLFIANFNN